MSKLPVGIQDFRTLVEDGYTYVDKTELIHRLISQGHSYFLSRPRRFGKSLLLSTLQALFQGDRQLFKGAWIEQSDYDWATYPVLMMDLTNVSSTSAEALSESLNGYLTDLADEHGVSIEASPFPATTLRRLITQLAKRGRVVLLIDEYDRPLVKHLGDGLLTEALRDVLQDFFATIKSLQQKIKFVFITGVSKFSKVSLFSGMNSLDDISLDAAYATLVGLTEEELCVAFAGHIERAADQHNLPAHRFVDRMRQWYNGYQFNRLCTVCCRVYNPWSVLKCLKTGAFDNYWFDTGTPTFAVELIRDRLFPLIDFERGVSVGSNLDMSVDPDSVDLATLLYQTGYLTIDSYDEIACLYHLKLPNEEVRRSLVDHLFGSYSGKETWQSGKFVEQMRASLRAGEMSLFFETFNTLLASIPYPLHIKQESYYHSLIYLCVRLLGFAVQAEVTTSRGRVDLVVEQDTAVYLFEFKIDSSADEALQQIRDNDYPRRFEESEKPIQLIGASFNTTSRQIDEWKETSWRNYCSLATS